MGGLSLLDGEKLILGLRPHPLAFWDMYLTWVWVILLSIMFIFWGSIVAEYSTGPLVLATSSVRGLTSYLPDPLKVVDGFVVQAGSFSRSYSPVAAWVVALIVSAALVSVLKISFKWVGLMAALGLVSVGLSYYFQLPPEASYHFGILLSLVAMSFVEVYRRAHRFYITDRRIVTEVRFGGVKRNELSFDKINNIVLDQDLIGSLFDFGTIIPVTASGLGMGSDISAVSVGTQGQLGGIPLNAQVTGGRTVQTPRVRSMYGLFGVTKPEEVQKIVSERLHDFIQAPYLKKMTNQLDDITKVLRKNDGGD
jgi:hypothetical protein